MQSSRHGSLERPSTGVPLCYRATGWNRGEIYSAFVIHPISKYRHSSFRYESAVVLSVRYAHENPRRIPNLTS